MTWLQAWKARVAARRRKEARSRARGLAGTPAAVRPSAEPDEFSAPEGPFGRLDVTPVEALRQPRAEAQSLPA